MDLLELYQLVYVNNTGVHEDPERIFYYTAAEAEKHAAEKNLEVASFARDWTIRPVLCVKFRSNIFVLSTERVSATR